MKTLNDFLDEAIETKSTIYDLQKVEIQFPGNPTDKVLKFAEIGTEIAEAYFTIFGLTFKIFDWVNVFKWITFIKKVVGIFRKYQNK